MTLAEFAEARRLRVRRDECGDPLIPGLGHVYEHGEGVHLGAMFLNLTPRRWTTIRRKLEAAGCVIWQDADGEGAVLLDPLNSAQVRTVLKLTGVRPKRISSEKQKAVLERARASRESLKSLRRSALVTQDASEGTRTTQTMSRRF